jgi:hypothetical protein
LESGGLAQRYETVMQRRATAKQRNATYYETYRYSETPVFPPHFCRCATNATEFRGAAVTPKVPEGISSGNAAGSR